MSTIQTGLLMLTEVRARAAAALAPIDDTDPPLLPEWVDAFHPPVLMLDWNTPWLEPGVGFRRGMGPCVWQAGLAVLCAASRVEPGAGMEQLEQLVTHTVRRLQADTSYRWPVATVDGPRRFDQAGIPYLATRVGYRVPVTI